MTDIDLTEADYDADDHPLQHAFDVAAGALHHARCNHHTGGPAECDSRAMTAVSALDAAGLLAAPDSARQVREQVAREMRSLAARIARGES